MRSAIAASALVALGVTAFAANAIAQDGKSGPLVTGEWLEKNLNDPKLRIVEVSVEPGLYERGHIPGAQNIVWTTDLVDKLERDIALAPGEQVSL